VATATKESDYELVLMLDPELPDAERDRIASEAQRRIESAGDLKHESAWGMRKLAYEIRQRTEADYRFFRFTGEPQLLDDLDHSLKIADGVLRFRIFKVDPRSPLIVPPEPIPGGHRRERSEGAARQAPPAPRPEAPAEGASEGPEPGSGEAPAPEAEAPSGDAAAGEAA